MLHVAQSGKALAIVLLTSFPLAVPAQKNAHAPKSAAPQYRGTGTLDQPIYLRDNSDKWSKFPAEDNGKPIPELKREPPPGVSRILGIDIKQQYESLAKAIATLGRAKAVSRGDASTGREQICYVSEAKAHDVHLIFEEGEVYEAYYLFKDVPHWNGESFCARSKLVSPDLRNDAGLGLGETRTQVESILGKPSLRWPNLLFYSFSMTKKTPLKYRIAARKANPRMSEKVFEEDYGSYYLNVNIEVDFRGQKSSYLGVSWSEQY